MNKKISPLNKKKIKLTIIIPVFNEIHTIGKILKKIIRIKNLRKQIIVVDDGSCDGTTKFLKSFNKKLFKLIVHNKNKGKGAAIRTAKKYINGDLVLIQDADLEYDPKDYKKLISPLVNKNYKVVYGSRVLNKNRYKLDNFLSISRVFFNHVLTILSNVLNNQKLTDAHTCYKVFDKDLFVKINLKENGFSFCPEITTKIGLKKILIKEIPINYYGRGYKEGKKIKFSDGIDAILTLIKYRFLV